MYSHSLTATVEGVKVTALNVTAVTISWNALVIPDFPHFSIDHYTVLYSRVKSQRRRRQDEALSIQFPSTAMSGVIAGLDSPATYQFQVFATVTVDDTSLEGETSSPFSFTIDGEHHYLFHNYKYYIIPSSMNVIIRTSMSDHIIMYIIGGK